jgi:SAM-dependent methyltransferase
MTEINLYANTAHLYDFDNREFLDYDVKLCLEYVNKTNGNILEIACGTGRVTIPILKNIPNCKVTAFDLSDKMLSVFKKKIKSACHNLQLAKADMRNFSFNQKFDLVILIWRAFQVLLEEEDAKKCLQNVRKHMNKDSVFLFSIFLPQKSYGADWVGKEIFSYEAVDPANGNKIKRYTKNLNSDEEKQIIEYASIYDIVTPEGKCEVLEDKIVYKYYSLEQIKKLLADCGFTILKEHHTSADMFFALGKALAF